MMKLTWFDEARTEAHTILKKKGALRYRDLKNLLCFEAYLSKIQHKEAATLRLLLEIAAVRHVSSAWKKAYGVWQAAQLEQMIEIFDYHITRPVDKDDPVACLPDSISPLENNFDLTLRKNNLDKIADEETIRQAHQAIMALSNAGIAIFLGDVEKITLHCQDEEFAKDPYFNNFYPDPYSTIAAIDALHALGGLLEFRLFGKTKQINIKYWTWYLDEALPWAVEETGKRLAAS